MKEVLQILHALENEAGEGVAALATLVSVEGSSYRRAGARMLWWKNRDGREERVGGISGGCLEQDLVVYCREVAEGGVATVVTYDTTDENDLVWGVGLGCNGVVRVLVEPVRGVPPMLAFVREAWARREAVVLVTAFSDNGGQTLLAKSEGGETLECGGRGREATGDTAFSSPDTLLVEKRCRRSALPPHSKEMLRQTADKYLREKKSAQEHMGERYLFFEYMPPVSLVVFGSGGDVAPLVRMAEELGWIVRVIRNGGAVPEDLDERSVAVVMTHHYVYDVPLVRALLPRRLAYLGLLGPKKRAEKILADLEREGFVATPEMRERLHAPVGLDLGGSTPESVALSILAEIQSVLAGRDARPLRERSGAIHEDAGAAAEVDVEKGRKYV